MVLTSDSEIRELNRQYLHRDHPTDVLAFWQSEERPLPTFDQKPSTKGPPPVLGDVVISVDTARRQAEENGLTLEQELGLLTIHGVLHLLGHEDETPARRKKMQRRQQEILAHLFPELAARADVPLA